MKTKTGSVLWRIQCWAALALAIFAYQVGSVLAAAILGVLTVLLFGIDFKATMDEEHEIEPTVSVTDAIAKLFRGLIVGAFIM